MNESFNELITVLTKEIELHTTLIDAAFAMNAAITTRSLEDIRRAGKCYDQCTCRIQELEEKRLALSDAICDRKGKETGHMSLLQVIERAPQEYRQRISTLRASLKDSIGKLSKINYSNQALLTESLKTIAKMFDYIALQGKQNASGYKRRGAKDGGRATTAIVNTVA